MGGDRGAEVGARVSVRRVAEPLREADQARERGPDQGEPAFVWLEPQIHLWKEEGEAARENGGGE